MRVAGSKRRGRGERWKGGKKESEGMENRIRGGEEGEGSRRRSASRDNVRKLTHRLV